MDSESESGVVGDIECGAGKPEKGGPKENAAPQRKDAGEL
jgi:hypothetical protein